MTPPSNNSVTLAVVGAKLDALRDVVEDYIKFQREDQKEITKRVGALEVEQSALKTNYGIWNVVNSIAAIIAAAVAAVFGSRP